MSKVVIITGASRGIGAATAELAAQRGYSVCVNYRTDRAAAEGVVEAIRGSGGKAIAVAADVATESDVTRLFAVVDKELGPLTALVKNAGILEQQMRLESMDAARLTRILATNVVGSFICAREAVRRMSTKHGGSGGASSTCRRPLRAWALQENTSTTQLPRARSIRSPSAWRAK